MSKATSKLQVTVPKSIANRFNIKPGDEIEWEATGETIRVVPSGKGKKSKTAPEDRLKLFDKEATKRQRDREATLDPASLAASAHMGRGWTRSDVYDRGSAG